MANPFVHVELNSQQPAKSKEFYGKLFDWKFEDMPMHTVSDQPYTTVGVGQNSGGVGGGIMKHPMPNAPTFWLAYVLVDDIKASTDKAKSLGAKVIRDVTEVPGMGWLSIIQDPEGAVLGLWKAAPMQQG